jgi:hypothetical protein
VDWDLMKILDESEG